MTISYASYTLTACGLCSSTAGSTLLPRRKLCQADNEVTIPFRRGGFTIDAIYARQSVEKADSLSIQSQIALCRREAGETYKVYQDRGYSGKNTNRPAFQKLMKDVEQGIIGKIVVYRLDRLSRSISDFSRLWEILDQHHVEFVSINESFDTAAPIGRAMLNIVMTFAQLERETTAERVRDNYYQRAKLGSWPGGPAPYGFSIGRLPGPDGRLSPALIPNDQAMIVERIFTVYAQVDTTLSSVARLLNHEGVPGPKRKVWDNVVLSRILHSPLYAMANEDIFLYYSAKGAQVTAPLEQFDGLHAAMLIGKRDRSAGKYREIRGQQLSIANHIGLISSNLWLQCQYKLESNRQIGRAGSGKHTWLSGLLKCGSCGYSVKVNRDKDKYYLVCSGRSNLKLCSMSIRVEIQALEASVQTELEHLLSQCPNVDEVTELAESAKELQYIDEKIEHLISAIAEGSQLTVAYINQAIKTLQSQREKLLDQHTKFHCHVHKSIKRIQFSQLNFEEKKLIAAQFIQEIQLSDDSAEVIWKI